MTSELRCTQDVATRTLSLPIVAPDFTEQCHEIITRRSSSSGFSSRQSSISLHNVNTLESIRQQCQQSESHLYDLFDPLRGLTVQSAVQMWEVTSELNPKENISEEKYCDSPTLTKFDCEEHFQKQRFDLKMRNIQFESEVRRTNNCVSILHSNVHVKRYINKITGTIAALHHNTILKCSNTKSKYGSSCSFEKMKSI
jgi:hypothetical protein